MAYAGLAHYGVGTNTAYVDVSEVLAWILKTDTTLIGLIGAGEAAEDPNFYWIEESLRPDTVTMSDTGGISNADATVNVATGHGLRCRVPCLLRNMTEVGKTELILVTAISADALTITRGYGNTTGEAHSDASVFQILFPEEEGSAPNTSWTQNRSRVVNCTYIYDRTLSISGTQQKAKMYAVVDEMAHQIEGRTYEIKREMDFNLINGVYYSSAASGTARTAKGIIEFISNDFAFTSCNADTDSEALDHAVVNGLVAMIDPYENAEPNLLVAGSTLCRKISTWGENYIRIDRTDSQRGNYVTSFLTDTGVVLNIVKDSNCPPGVVLVLDSNRIKTRPYRPLFIKEYDNGNDAIERRIIEESSFEVRNATEAHGIATNKT